MREILFRAKLLNNKQWGYGFYCYTWPISGTSTSKNHYLLINNEDFYLPKFYPIVPETLGQYTGLKDKNENRIFYGDIVLKKTRYNKYPMRVFFDNGKFFCGFGDRVPSCNRLSQSTYRYNLDDPQIEVIGNVYDNPEMFYGVPSTIEMIDKNW